MTFTKDWNTGDPTLIPIAPGASLYLLVSMCYEKPVHGIGSAQMHYGPDFSFWAKATKVDFFSDQQH